MSEKRANAKEMRFLRKIEDKTDKQIEPINEKITKWQFRRFGHVCFTPDDRIL